MIGERPRNTEHPARRYEFIRAYKYPRALQHENGPCRQRGIPVYRIHLAGFAAKKDDIFDIPFVFAYTKSKKSLSLFQQYGLRPTFISLVTPFDSCEAAFRLAFSLSPAFESLTGLGVISELAAGRYSAARR